MLVRLLPLVMIAGFVASCAKEKSYDTVYKKPELQKKSDFKTHKMVRNAEGKLVKEPIKYMYVPMTLGTPREVRAARPFFQGDEKVVRLEWGEKGLNVIEFEKDERFNDNPLNDVPVLTIPGEYKKYQCKEDEFGDCTNAEEEDTEVTWERKSHFIPDYSSLNVRELNTLDVWGVSNMGCMSTVDTQVVDYEISDGVVNIELEKTYKINNSFMCFLMNLFEDKFSFNSFKVRFMYSIVELDKLATPDYKAISYPIPDHDEYGYFKTEKTRLNDDFDPRRAKKEFFVNRFNPNQPNGELVYYLSKTFNKPKNALLKKATYDGVEIINKGLAQANVPFKMVLKEQGPNDNIKSGDLRYNTIVLIDDPLANGLLGYGPSVKNPYTGEIVQAHTNMYGGVLTMIARSTYESAVDVTVEQNEQEKESKTGEIKVLPTAYTNLPETLVAGLIPEPILGEEIVEEETEEGEATEGETSEGDEATDATNVSDISIEEINQRIGSVKMGELVRKLEHRLHTKRNYKEDYLNLLNGDYEGLNELEIKEFEREKAAGNIHLEHKHTPEFFPIAGTVKVVFPELMKIPGIVNADNTLKRWATLTDEQRKKVIDIILYNSYLSTFIHEIGHNLGLRHNFSGSFDKDNFYSQAEADALGLNGIPAYSSVMDYSYSEFNQLQALGKYDVAALRFAYAREVETADGQFVSLNQVVTNQNGDKEEVSLTIQDLDKALEAQGLERKSYMFCTDENAGLSSTCNRFDEGTSLKEIAKFRALRYKQYYRYRNLRDGRLEFNTYGLAGYTFARRHEFGQVRDFLEEYEFFAELFGKDIMAQGCPPPVQAANPNICNMISDRKDAVEIASDMLLEIVKTPDHLCALVKENNPKVVVEFRPLRTVYDRVKWDIDHVPLTCFDQSVKDHVKADGLLVVGENGKYLNGFKDTDPNYKYVSDRAVRGVWIDKVLAFEQLFKRRWRNRTTDRNHMALVDIPFVAEKVNNVVNHLVLGKPLANPIPFSMEDGNTFQIPYVIGNDYKIDQLEDVFGWLKRYLGMPRNGKANLTDVALQQVAMLGIDYGEEAKEDAKANYYGLGVVASGGFISESNRDPSREYLVRDNNITLNAGTENALAFQMISTINNKAKLEAVEKEIIEKVLKRRTEPEAPADFDEAKTAFFGLALADMNFLMQNPALEEAVFVRVFGEEQGKLIFSVYKAGPEVMLPILSLKTKLMNEPDADASQAERDLYDLPILLLEDFLAGKITDGIVDYYKGQLDKLIWINR